MVERLAALHWRERRLVDTERRLIKKGKDFVARSGEPGKGFISPFFPLDGISLEDQLLIGRYLTMLNNQIAQTLAMLRHAQDHGVDDGAIDGDFEVLPAVNDSVSD